MKEAGFGSVAHVPCIFNGLWEYEVEASLYMRERALLEASSIDASQMQMRTLRYPTPNSLKTFGYAIANFLEWCEANVPKLRWEDAKYTEDIIQGYQADMLSGIWSERGRRLAAATVNGRVGEACRFLRWAANRGLRGPFRVISSSRAVSSDSTSSAIGHRPRIVEQRAGAVRPDPKEMRMPEDSEMAAWHQDVRIRHGFSKALACEAIIKSGVRREEAAQWRVDTLPLDRECWEVRGDWVTVLVKYGVKGQKVRDETGELAAPGRLIVIPLEFAERLAEYREVQRPRLLAMFAKAAPTPKERRVRMSKPSNRLFLSDFDGRPISAVSIYNAWTKVSRSPFPGWSPHPGRHYWACKWLLDGVRKRHRSLELGCNSDLSRHFLTATAEEILMFEVKPQLGHLSRETTERYLTWLRSSLMLNDVSDAYAESLDAVARTAFEV